LYFSNKLNFCYYHRFPMKHLLHLSKLWIVFHFMSIQPTNVACIWRCLLWFLTLLATSMATTLVYSFFFLHVSTLWLFIPQFVQYLLVFLILLCGFGDVTRLVLCGTKNVLFVSIIIIPSSHNNIASLCCCSLDRFIPKIAILKYDYKFAL
jgi:hypothetical protein